VIDQGIKSRPVYDRLRIDHSGLRHLFVADKPSFPVEALAFEVQDLEVWTVAPPASEGVSPISADERRRSFRSVQGLLQRLTHRLKDERMGFRLYAAGKESFLWDVYGTAQQAGLGKQEVFLAHHGSMKRRVMCVHCRTFNEGVTSTIAQCEGCGAQLFVRDHFSRRLSAYMGVKVDAELPGDVPPAEQAYP
jgi:dimethylamine monooxygenase subunit C